MIKRTEIKIKTYEIKIIRSRVPNSAYCERCEESVTTFTPEQIAAVFQMTLSEVCRCIQTNKFHLVETRRGIALVCGGLLEQR